MDNNPLAVTATLIQDLREAIGPDHGLEWRYYFNSNHQKVYEITLFRKGTKVRQRTIATCSTRSGFWITHPRNIRFTFQDLSSISDVSSILNTLNKVKENERETKSPA